MSQYTQYRVFNWNNSSGNGIYSLKIFLKDFIYLFDRERKWENTSRCGGGGQQAEGEADCPLSREPHAELDPRTLRSLPELKADASLTEPPRCPQGTVFRLVTGDGLTFFSIPLLKYGGLGVPGSLSPMSAQLLISGSRAPALPCV